MKRKFDLFKLRELDQKEARGGLVSNCNCGCAYANCPGGSSFGENYGANYSEGYKITEMIPQC